MACNRAQRVAHVILSSPPRQRRRPPSVSIPVLAAQARREPGDQVRTLDLVDPVLERGRELVVRDAGARQGAARAERARGAVSYTHLTLPTILRV